MTTTSQQVKSFVTLGYADCLTAFHDVSDDQVARSYFFTDQLWSITAQILSTTSINRASLIVGKRGIGKSHLLALLRSLITKPNLVESLQTTPERQRVQPLNLDRLNSQYRVVTAISYDLNKQSFIISNYTSGGYSGTKEFSQLTASAFTNLIDSYINSQAIYTLLFDDLSLLCLMENQHEELLKQVVHYLQKASKGQLTFVATLNQDLLESNSKLINEIISLCHVETIELTNIPLLVEQMIFRKSLQQRKALEELYRELRVKMLHFKWPVTDFIRLYPCHPMLVNLSSILRNSISAFSLFGFLSDIAGRAIVRRSFNLISLDDLFDRVEFDLRRDPRCSSLFELYDRLSGEVTKMGGQNGLYGKIMLKGLLLLYLANQSVTIAELADAVMLYDDRNPEAFIRNLSDILSHLNSISPELVTEPIGTQLSYRLQIKTTKESIKTAEESLTVLQPADSLILRLDKAASEIANDNPRLEQLLLSAGKAYFSDWPIGYDEEGNFHDRVEVTIKWRGSLRKGIISYNGAIDPNDLTTQYRVIKNDNEHDWEIKILPASFSLLPLSDYSPTTLHWTTSQLTEIELAQLKQLLIAYQESDTGKSIEGLNDVIQSAEKNVAEIFARAYLGQSLLGHKNNSYKMDYLPGTLLTTILSRVLDQPLSTYYPQHPIFEDLLDVDYINEIAGWMFQSEQEIDHNLSFSLEQFALPLGLVEKVGDSYIPNPGKLDNNDASPQAILIATIQREGGSLTEKQAYQLLRKAPYGLQRPELLLILAALAATNKVVLSDEKGNRIHNETGLIDGYELNNFRVISLPSQSLPVVSWQEQSSKSSTASYAHHTILIVEDDAITQTLIKAAIKPLGCKIQLASDGQQALNILGQHQIDFVISDLCMPNMNGVALFNEMQANPQWRNIPFVVLTGIDEDEEVTNALARGVEDYWLKPFRPQEITNRIRRLLHRSLTSAAAYAVTAWPETSVKPISSVSEPGTDSFNRKERKKKTTAYTTARLVKLPPPPPPIKQSVAETVPQSTAPTQTETVSKEVAPPIKQKQEIEIPINLLDQKAFSLKLVSLYEQFQTACRDAGNTKTILAFEEFEEKSKTQAEKLQLQFNCQTLSYIIKQEDKSVHIYCRVERNSSYLTKQPMFLLI